MLKQRSLRLLLGTTTLLFLFPLIVFASAKLMEEPGEKRPDILTIDIPPSESRPDGEDRDMPPVEFKHDLHTRAVEGQCIKCHDSKDGKTVFKFKRLEDAAGADYMDLYHENCLACHGEMKGKSGGQGPMEAQCRACHNAKPKVGSSRVKISFDRSLHYTHEKSKAIKSGIKEEETNCNACHHSANIKAGTTFYEKGKESACIYCHKPVSDTGTESKVRPTRNAAHDSCVACHLKMTEDKIEAGPVECAGCHDSENIKKIKVNTDIPRLDRSQPDQALMTGWTDLGTDPEKNRQTIAAHMDAVPFNHKAHEARNISCKACHHQALDKCSSCHTATGQEKGGFITLAKAMHSGSASRSCIGCHNEMKTAKDCAGCHAQMPQKAAKDQNCAACHSMDVKSENPDLLKDTKASGNLALAAIEAKPYARINLKEIPETVEIKTIADEYQPSNFPHRMVVEAIFKKVEGNGMANAFHGTDLTLCAGCHHNSPPTLTPPKCASCHEKTPDIATGKPGLKGAYHGQCITCHQKMEVKSVLPTDCTKCHEKKE